MHLRQFFKILGPGVLFASTAIGVSHLVQCTRAGASFGFGLLLWVIAANLFKYPFFEYGTRYAASTGTSLLDGYLEMGRWVLWIYFGIVFSSMFFVLAAVSFVTIGFMDNLFGISSIWPEFDMFPTLVLFVFCNLFLIIGRYSALDKLTKVLGSILVVSTLMAFILTLFNGPVEQVSDFTPPDLYSDESVLFTIALMGWMPTALDLSAWNSLWTLEKNKTMQENISVAESTFEFKVGYVIAAILAVIFLAMGSLMLYGSGIEMPAGSSAFASSIIDLYVDNLGSWSFLIIATAAFSIMFSTNVAIFDGFSRVMERIAELLFVPNEAALGDNKRRVIYNLSILTLSAGSFSLIAFYLDHFQKLIDLATTISFLLAPLVAVANFILVTKHIRKEDRPGVSLRILSWLGIVFLTGFSVYYLTIIL